MPRFKLRTFNDYFVEHKDVNFSKTDIIDRTGYVDLGEQFSRMMSSGVNLNRVIDEQYSYEWNELKALFNNDSLDVSSKVTVRRFNDLTELDSSLKSKLQAYKNSLDSEKLIKDSYQKYLKSLETERIKQEAINEYIAKYEKGEKKNN